jgi:hypothetical protein
MASNSAKPAMNGSASRSLDIAVRIVTTWSIHQTMAAD